MRREVGSDNYGGLSRRKAFCFIRNADAWRSSMDCETQANNKQVGGTHLYIRSHPLLLRGSTVGRKRTVCTFRSLVRRCCVYIRIPAVHLRFSRNDLRVHCICSDPRLRSHWAHKCRCQLREASSEATWWPPSTQSRLLICFSSTSQLMGFAGGGKSLGCRSR